MSSTNDFLQKTHPLVRPIAKATIKSITDSYGKFDTDMKWGQLTFALNGDFDHWICAVSTTKKVVYVKFHFGSLLKDRHGLFSADSGKFIRKLEIAAESDINEKALSGLIDQAVKRYPYFKEHWKEMR